MKEEGSRKGKHERKRDEYIQRRNKIWSEGERDGGVLIREATVMPRPTTTTLPPPLLGSIFSQLCGKSFAIEEYLSIVKIYNKVVGPVIVTLTKRFDFANLYFSD